MANPMLGPISNLINQDYNSAYNSAANPVVTDSGMQPEKPRVVESTADSAKEKKAGRRSSPEECETCKNRKYQDGSNENVSFKSPSHISPESAGSAVRAHENEHVSNAYTSAAQKNGKVLSAVVSLHTAVCPECGRTYVAGGTTSTKIKYYNDDNAYGKILNKNNAAKYNGANVDVKG